MTEVTTANVASATGIDLTIITYELILNEIEEVRKYVVDKDDMRLTRHLDKAKNYLEELMFSLDMSYPISYDLLSLYLYINKNLVTFRIKNDEKLLKDSDKIVNHMLETWKMLKEKAEKENDQTVMKNTEKIYTGFTYDRAGLSETVFHDHKRGIRA